jgi:hypothetical protein
MGSACFIKVTQSLIYHVRIITANLSQGYNSNMSFKIASHQTENYRVTTELYEGPLDLLLQLIERAELDITRLALAQVTDQYLVHLKNMQEHSAAEVSAFLSNGRPVKKIQVRLWPLSYANIVNSNR